MIAKTRARPDGQWGLEASAHTDRHPDVDRLIPPAKRVRPTCNAACLNSRYKQRTPQPGRTARAAPSAQRTRRAAPGRVAVPPVQRIRRGRVLQAASLREKARFGDVATSPTRTSRPTGTIRTPSGAGAVSHRESYDRPPGKVLDSAHHAPAVDDGMMIPGHEVARPGEFSQRSSRTTAQRGASPPQTGRSQSSATLFQSCRLVPLRGLHSRAVGGLCGTKTTPLRPGSTRTANLACRS